MSLARVAILSLDDTLCHAVAAACKQIGVGDSIESFSTATQFLQSSSSFHLVLVDTEVVDLDAYGEVLHHHTWVYLSHSDFVPVDALQYRPVAGCNASDAAAVQRTIASTLVYVLRDNGLLVSDKSLSAISLRRINGKSVEIEVGSIAYCRTNGDFVDIHLYRDNDLVKITVQERMKTLCAMLCDNGFVQVHRLWLVNISSVIANHPYPKDRIMINGGLEIPLARRRKIDFLKAYRAQK